MRALCRQSALISPLLAQRVPSSPASQEKKVFRPLLSCEAKRSRMGEGPRPGYAEAKLQLRQGESGGEGPLLEKIVPLAKRPSSQRSLGFAEPVGHLLPSLGREKADLFFNLVV
jgi:hypothetical protein